MTCKVQLGSSPGFNPTFPSTNPHFKATFASLTLCQVLSGGRQRQILLLEITSSLLAHILGYINYLDSYFFGNFSQFNKLPTKPIYDILKGNFMHKSKLMRGSTKDAWSLQHSPVGVSQVPYNKLSKASVAREEGPLRLAIQPNNTHLARTAARTPENQGRDKPAFSK